VKNIASSLVLSLGKALKRDCALLLKVL